jgi:hypothetical protein
MRRYDRYFPAMASDRDEEPGVLGNLPRSRPGRRSDKRGGTGSTRAKKSAPAAKPASSKRTTRASAPRKKAAPATPRAAAGTRAQPPPRPAPAPARQGGGDPLGQAVQLAGKVAAIGVRTAADIVKRLPRP